MLGRLNVKRRMEKIYLVNFNKKEAEVAVISDKVDFRTNEIPRDREGHYLMIKGSIH